VGTRGRSHLPSTSCFLFLHLFYVIFYLNYFISKILQISTPPTTCSSKTAKTLTGTRRRSHRPSTTRYLFRSGASCSSSFERCFTFIFMLCSILNYLICNFYIHISTPPTACSLGTAKTFAITRRRSRRPSTSRCSSCSGASCSSSFGRCFYIYFYVVLC
jgi:hypothetical protein